MRVAARSTAIGGGSEAAFGRVLEAMAEAAVAGVDLLVLPELCLSGVAADAAEARALAEELAHRGVDDLEEAARDHDLSVVVGRYALEDGEVVNRAELIAPGGLAQRYDKIHRFDALGALESKVVAGGSTDASNLPVVSMGEMVVGQATCFDLRFPELALALAARGAQLLAVGAAWYAGEGKADQLELVARARAADAGLVVVLAAAAGVGFTGRSMVVAPDGALLASGDAPVAQIEPEMVRAQRARLPLAKLRRLAP